MDLFLRNLIFINVPSYSYGVGAFDEKSAHSSWLIAHRKKTVRREAGEGKNVRRSAFGVRGSGKTKNHLTAKALRPELRGHGDLPSGTSRV
jgi:hypothetical protein